MAKKEKPKKENFRKLSKEEHHFKGSGAKFYKIGDVIVNPDVNVRIFSDKEVIEYDDEASLNNANI